jgi:hypothetical protein
MAGPGKILGSPWIPLAVRAWMVRLIVGSTFDFLDFLSVAFDVFEEGGDEGVDFDDFVSIQHQHPRRLAHLKMNRNGDDYKDHSHRRMGRGGQWPWTP